MNLPNIAATYVLYHTPSNRFYIGSTGNLSARLYCHKSTLNRRTHSNDQLQMVYRHWNEFECWVIPMPDKATAVFFEQQLLDRYLGDPACFNTRKAMR